MDNSDEKSRIKKLLAEYLGLEIEDISDDDSLSSDLHMRPSDISDFLTILEENNIDTSKLDLSVIDTLEDLYERLLAGF